VAFDGKNYLITYGKQGLIFGMRVTPLGMMLDDPPGIQISPGPPYSSNYFSAVAFDGTNYFVVWSESRSEDHLAKIRGAHVTPQGQVLDKINISSGLGHQFSPSVAFDGMNYMVIWEDEQPKEASINSETKIMGARVTREGGVLDPDAIPISTAPNYQESPHIIFDGTNYFAVWVDLRRYPISSQPSNSDIFGARIRPDGTLLDGPPDTGGIPINTSPFMKHNPIAVFDRDKYFVVWDQQSVAPAGIFGSEVSKDGKLMRGTSDESGILLSEPLPLCDCLVTPNIYANTKGKLITWIDLRGKDIVGAFLFQE
jgi:hypothetical protein